MSDLYHQTILEEYKQPRHQGSLSKPDVVVDDFNASCGDQVHIELQLSDAQAGQDAAVTDLKWQGNGCAISQATMSLLAEKIVSSQLTLKQILAMKLPDVLELVGLDEISEGRKKCLMLGLAGLQREITKLISNKKQKGV